MKKIVIITGLTCSGKSGLAIKIAKEFNGEIISADSVQIYRKLDIGSAKEPLSTRKEIKHHLIDIKDFNETYNVGEFISDCKNAIDEIISKPFFRKNIFDYFVLLSNTKIGKIEKVYKKDFNEFYC